MFKFISKFRKEESGAVTVDWVVLAGAVVALAIGVVATVEGGLETAATGVNNQLSNAVNTLQDQNLGS
ncbi:Flp family type IVb pilin [Pontivivens ytuae]|uniref:Pilus assembly protein n=1 Tax=Pontivivens ytuae TaxID=2789856 RepID=A0A7S9LUA9_9RHOB|nr:hypothetical protein [Pontivivens ytuae]QPH55301.1 hypothetical protein I0K15_06060 [Pontivivens ytuae]